MTRSRTTSISLALGLTLHLGACRGATGTDVADTGEQGSLPPPAAAFSGTARVGLAARLEDLEANLDAILENDLDENGQALLLRAEAATDRLLEDQPERDWLDSGYYVEARLRQIQALADRVVAELRRGVAHELVLEDIASLRHAVSDLRTQLATDGQRNAPPPLDSLLAAAAEPRTPAGRRPAGASTTTSETGATTPAPAPAAAPEGAPLGQPIRP